MRNPADFFRDHISQALEQTMNIPLERPDLLKADTRKRYLKAVAWGVFAVGNKIASTKGYGPHEIRLEEHIANLVAFTGGIAIGFTQGAIGIAQRVMAENLSFRALYQQLQQPDEPIEGLPPDPSEME
jgi:hypothetical protein